MMLKSNAFINFFNIINLKPIFRVYICVPIKYIFYRNGELSEWLKEHAWKVCIRETVSRVRIPYSPHIDLSIQ